MNIYVGNLSWQMTDEDLRNLFEQHGTVGSAKIVKDKVSGRSKGFGFVEMEDDGEAQQAITNLYDSEVMGDVKSSANESQPKQQGGSGGGGGYKKRSFGGGGGGGGYKKEVAAMTVAAAAIGYNEGLLILLKRKHIFIKIAAQR